MSCILTLDQDSIEVNQWIEIITILGNTPEIEHEEIIDQLSNSMIDLVNTDEEFLSILRVVNGKHGSKLSFLKCFGNNLHTVMNKNSTLSSTLFILKSEDTEYLFSNLWFDEDC